MRAKNRKILFVTPPYHCGVVEVAGNWPPLGFVYLGAQALKAGWDVQIYDAMTLRHDHKAIADYLNQTDFDIFATSAITPTFPDASEICRIAKMINPDCTTIIGGVHPSFCYDKILTYAGSPIDYIIRGEGELPLYQFLVNFDDKTRRHQVPNLAFAVDGKIKINPCQPLNPDLDTLETAWHLLDWNLYTYHVIDNSILGAVSTSRGCSHGCTFCSQQRFWNQTWRGRLPEKVLKEIKHLNQEYGINVFLFTDEYPTYDSERWELLLDLLIKEGLGIYILIETRVEDIIRDKDILPKYRKAGIVHVYVGAEATDQNTLDKINKGITVDDSRRAIELLADNGMISETSFVLGFPDETPQSIEQTFKLAKVFNPDFAHFLAITPWPYAEFYEEVKNHIAVDDYRMYNLIEPIIRPNGMTLGEIDKAIIDCYRRFYMSKMLEFRKCVDPFKKKYLLTSMKLIMKSSFLREKFARLGLNAKIVMDKMFDKRRAG